MPFPRPWRWRKYLREKESQDDVDLSENSVSLTQISTCSSTSTVLQWGELLLFLLIMFTLSDLEDILIGRLVIMQMDAVPVPKTNFLSENLWIYYKQSI